MKNLVQVLHPVRRHLILVVRHMRFIVIAIFLSLLSGVLAHVTQSTSKMLKVSLLLMLFLRRRMLAMLQSMLHV